MLAVESWNAWQSRVAVITIIIIIIIINGVIYNATSFLLLMSIQIEGNGDSIDIVM
jgi:hypothetical protein